MLNTYRPYLTNCSQVLLPSHLIEKVEPDDLVQETLKRVCNHEERFVGRTEEEVRAYLIKALRSVIRDLLRRFDRGKRRVSSELSIESFLDDSVARPDRWLAADHTSPTRKARRNEESARLAQALTSLPAEQSRAIELHHLNGMSLVETAEAMGKTRDAAAGLIRRGLQTLRERLVEPAE